ncbi:MAG: RNA polymerase sigma factor [Flavobacteriales bacterium]|jgi:RNA polymerase sigma-70 factor (ECF subfamily)
MPARSSYTLLGDDRLMELIASRDQKAFEVLYDRYGKLLYNYFHKMLWKDKEKARDFAQDLFTKIVHRPELYDPARPFKTWIYSVAHNMCKNEYARHEVRRSAHEEIRSTDHFTAMPVVQGAMDRELFRQKLAQALDELDEVKRTTFELRFHQDMSILDISEVMECSEGTVKSRLFYTLKELNKKLKMFEGILGLLTLIMTHLI